MRLTMGRSLQGFRTLAEGGSARVSYYKKLLMLRIKLKFFGINERFVEKPLCQCHWEILRSGVLFGVLGKD